MAQDRENLIWGPIENARTLLAASPAFRTLVEETNTEGARAHMYPALPDAAAAAAARPCAIVDQGTNREMERISTTGFSNAGSVLVILEADVPAAHQGETAAQREAAHKWFLSLLGDIIDDLMAGSNESGRYRMTGVRLTERPARADITDAHDYYQVMLELDWRTA